MDHPEQVPRPRATNRLPAGVWKFDKGICLLLYLLSMQSQNTIAHGNACTTLTQTCRLVSDNQTLQPAELRLLHRKHAALVARDDVINPLFVRECWMDMLHHPPHRFCVSDEHYIPTLLAAHGAAQSTVCCLDDLSILGGGVDRADLQCLKTEK